MGWYIYCVAEVPSHEHPVLTERGVEEGCVEVIQEDRGGGPRPSGRSRANPAHGSARGSAPVTCPAAGLAVIVSYSPRTGYRVRRELVLPHIRVIEEVMQRYVVLPVRFGTVARSPEQIRQCVFVKEGHGLLGLIEKMRDKFEAGVKVMYERPAFFEELRREYPELGRQADRAQTQLERIGLGRRVQQAVEAKAAREAEHILSRLRPVANDTRVNTGMGDVMVLNAAFLVHRGRGDEFDAAVFSVEKEYRGRAVVRYVAPVPPFNFINLVLHLEGEWEEEVVPSGPEESLSAGQAERMVAGVSGG